LGGAALQEIGQGHYQHIFVALHPFYRIAGLSPVTAGIGPVHVDFNTEQLIDLLKTDGDEDMSKFSKWVNEQDGQDEYDEDQLYDLAKFSSTEITWQKIRSELSSSSFAEFALATWVATLEIEREDANMMLAYEMRKYCLQNHIYMPVEDSIPNLFDARIASAFSMTGDERIEIQGLHDDERQTLLATELAERDHRSYLCRQNYMTSASRQLLFTSLFDEIYTFIAMTSEAHAQYQPNEHFEGFYVQPDTAIDWINQLSANERH
jgi:hypothetical protein